MNTAVAQTQQSIRFRARSFLAFALSPEPPVADWLGELDKCIRNSTGFFLGKPVILDLSAVKLSEQAILHLIEQLAERGIRVMGLEGADPAVIGPKLPPVLMGGRPGGEERAQASSPAPARDVPEKEPTQTTQAPSEAAASEAAASEAAASEAGPAASVTPLRPEPASMLIESPVRSGQSIIFPFGEVTVLGSVASGAEIVAGGSIHIYGALRGRAMAGSSGDPRARIFCSRNEAELLAIDGYYQTAESMDASLRGRAVQVRLEDAGLNVEALD